MVYKRNTHINKLDLLEIRKHCLNYFSWSHSSTKTVWTIRLTNTKLVSTKMVKNDHGANSEKINTPGSMRLIYGKYLKLIRSLYCQVFFFAKWVFSLTNVVSIYLAETWNQTWIMKIKMNNFFQKAFLFSKKPPKVEENDLSLL